MKNKKIIRKTNEASKFTTIHHSILNDKRLTSLAFRILVSILSDSDSNFNLSQKLLINRFNLTKNTLKSALKNLEECGYIKRTKLKRGHYYTVSEYGNLNTDSIVEEIIETIQPVESDKIIIETPTEKIDLNEVAIQIVNLVGNTHSDAELAQILTYFDNSIQSGKLKDKSQLTNENILKVITKILPSNDELKKAKDEISEYVFQRITEKGLTIGKRKDIHIQVMNWVETQSIPDLTTKMIDNKRLQLQSKYISHGDLDQRFQN